MWPARNVYCLALSRKGSLPPIDAIYRSYTLLLGVCTEVTTLGHNCRHQAEHLRRFFPSNSCSLSQTLVPLEQETFTRIFLAALSGKLTDNPKSY